MSYPCTSAHLAHWPALQTNIYVRCRNCKNCLNARQHLWVVRAAHEQMRAKRTWFVTFTFSPKKRATILEHASAMESGSQITRLTKAAGWYVGAFTKKLRKASFRLRYVYIAEPHANGFPHFHGIIHDQSGWSTVKSVWRRNKKTGEYQEHLTCPELESVWESNGFVNTELVRNLGAIRYVTKYMAEGRYGRIRASRNYGEIPEEDTTNVVRAETSELTRVESSGATEQKVSPAEERREANSRRKEWDTQSDTAGAEALGQAPAAYR